MNPKRIVIFYTKQSYGSVARAERIFVDVIKQMESEGREIKDIDKDTAYFKDGTRIDKLMFGRGIGILGLRVTHCYIDKHILTLNNSEEYIRKAVMPIVVEKSYKLLDAEGDSSERIMVFDNESIEKLSFTK